MASKPLPTLFITGSMGYIGGTFLTVLKRSQPSILVRALVRDTAQADALSALYGWTVTPIIGKLEDLGLLKSEASKADIVIHACGDQRASVLAMIEGVSLNPKNASFSDRPIFVQISGASNVGHPVMGEDSPRVWSDVDDWADLLALSENRTSVGTDNAIRKLSSEKHVRSLTLAPPTILGRGLGAGRTETFQSQMYDAVIKNGAAFLGGSGTNQWSVISIEDLGRACVFILELAQNGDDRIQYGQNGYYFIEAFELSIGVRMKALGQRLYREGRIQTPEVQMKSIEWIKEHFGEFSVYLFGSSSRCKADKLRALGWKTVDSNWLRMVQEAPGYRC
ncbi:NAD(P)-binding protein [Amniculicola lignicola CBS 123094]|uniref:NAD(P)-binding protein n=1 Tax=Amniculicola lignicola CBS 123094 TaxID=1392246 RepID=A0A6A5WF30_9PLEO|nr:NAD(P)-binding protein [Amniculicola lignicola CBS 123094]